LPDSVAVAVKVSMKSPSLLLGGVTVKEASVQLVMSTLVWPAVALKECVPSLSVAPTGMALTTRASVSEPSVSTSEVVTLSEMAVSSLPLAGATARLGASATALMVMVKSSDRWSAPGRRRWRRRGA